MIDRQLNYGRAQIVDLAKKIHHPISVVLDIGAGTGADLLNLKSVFPEARLIGLESYPDNVAKLESNGIVAHQVDIERAALPFEDESIDLIVTNQFLEHTKDIFWILHEVSRVLKPGGTLIIGVPNLASLHNRLLLLAGRQPTCIQTASAHVRGFTKHDLNRALEKIFTGGYELQGYRGCNFYPFPGWLAAPLARIFPNMAWGMILHFVKRKKYQREFLMFPVEEKLETNFFLGS